MFFFVLQLVNMGVTRIFPKDEHDFQPIFFAVCTKLKFGQIFGVLVGFNTNRDEKRLYFGTSTA